LPDFAAATVFVILKRRGTQAPYIHWRADSLARIVGQQRTIRGTINRLKWGLKRHVPRARLLAKLPRNAVGAEVGVWKGDFSSLLFGVTRPKHLHLVDPWTYAYDPDFNRPMYGGRDTEGQQRMDGIHDDVCRRFAKQTAQGRLTVWRLTSIDASHELGPLDWVYIDACHDYENVKNDLEAYYPLVKPGGTIAGDDYGTIGWWEDGVRHAVIEFAEANRCSVRVIGSQYIFTKPHASADAEPHAGTEAAPPPRS